MAILISQNPIMRREGVVYNPSNGELYKVKLNAIADILCYYNIDEKLMVV